MGLLVVIVLSFQWLGLRCLKCSRMKPSFLSCEVKHNEFKGQVFFLDIMNVEDNTKMMKKLGEEDEEMEEKKLSVDGGLARSKSPLS